MNTAEFRVLREALGLSLIWMSKNGPRKVNTRTATRWETDVTRIPDDIAAFLRETDKKFDDIAQKMLEKVKLLEEKNNIDFSKSIIPLYRYKTEGELATYFPEMAGYPLRAQDAVLYRIKKLLEANGYTVSIDYKTEEQKRYVNIDIM